VYELNIVPVFVPVPAISIFGKDTYYPTGLKQSPKSLAGILKGDCGSGGASQQVPALGASQQHGLGLDDFPPFLGEIVSGVRFGDWQENEYMADFASKLWNLNKPIFADAQYNCGPAPSPAGKLCSLARCAASADAFRVDHKCVTYNQSGKCVTNDGCIVEPGE
jgi:hypothetical protein